jgi:hypothetical protein
MAETSRVNKRTAQRHEERDVQLKPIVMLGVGLIVITLGVLLLMDLTFDAFSARRAQQDIPPSPLAKTSQLFPQPHLQIKPAQALQKLRAEEDDVLSSYAWLDRANGIVRIPIERAIDLLVERGLPARNTNPGGS